MQKGAITMKGIIKAIEWIKRRFRNEKKREGYYFADGREAEIVYADTIEAADAPLVYDPEIALSKEPVELTVHFDEEAMRRALEAFQGVKEALAKMAEIIMNCSNVLFEEIACGKYDSKYGWRDEHEKEMRKITDKSQKRLDTEENYRYISADNIEVKMSNGRWINLDECPMNWLTVLIQKEEFNGIRADIQKRIDLIKGEK